MNLEITLPLKDGQEIKLNYSGECTLSIQKHLYKSLAKCIKIVKELIKKEQTEENLSDEDLELLSLINNVMADRNENKIGSPMGIGEAAIIFTNIILKELLTKLYSDIDFSNVEWDLVDDDAAINFIYPFRNWSPKRK